MIKVNWKQAKHIPDTIKIHTTNKDFDFLLYTAVDINNVGYHAYITKDIRDIDNISYGYILQHGGHGNIFENQYDYSSLESAIHNAEAGLIDIYLQK